MPDDSAHRFGSRGERTLQAEHGTDSRAAQFYDRQVRAKLNAEMLAFVARMEMVFVASADAGGQCDCSIRCGPAGFVRALDDRTLVYPEYRGNGVMATLGNVSENAHVGLLFVDFFQDCVGLHVNGRATIVETDALLAMPDVPESVRKDATLRGGRRPERWVRVHVHEAYIHCAKHIPMLARLPKQIAWGTDDTRAKGGDYFRLATPREPTIADHGNRKRERDGDGPNDPA